MVRTSRKVIKMKQSRRKKEREVELTKKLSIELEKMDSLDTVEVGLNGCRQLFINYTKTSDIKLILSKLQKIIGKPKQAKPPKIVKI